MTSAPDNQRHEHEPGHVRDNSPFDFHHTEPGVGADESHLRAKRELQASTERDAVNRGDNRNGEIGPRHHGLLIPVGDAVRIGGERISSGRRVAASSETRQIETGAERTPRAVQHDGANVRVATGPIGGCHEVLKACLDKRIEPVGTIEADVGDTARAQRDGDMGIHDLSP